MTTERSDGKLVEIQSMEATPQEMEAMISVNKQAFGPDPLVEFAFFRPGVTPETTEELVNKHQKRMANPQFTYYKAFDPEDPSGRILGVAVWYWVSEPQTETVNGPAGDWPPGAHRECLEASLGAIRRWRYHHFREHNQCYVYMNLLTVRPDLQRRGVGSALLREGLKAADRAGWPAFISASPSGLSLYKKFGWEEVTTASINLKEYGGSDVDCSVVGLIRPPGAVERPPAPEKKPPTAD